MPILGTIASGYIEPNLYWNRSLGGGSQGQDSSGGLILDSTNNVYLSSRNLTSGGSTYNHIQSKFSSNGSILWQRRVTDAIVGYKIAIDSSDNTYYCGTDFSSSGNNGILILKYNSSGTLQWQRNLGSFQSIGSAVGCDSSDNIYVFGRSNANGSYFDGIVAKYNSSGTIQWQRRLSPSTNNPFYVEGGSVDSSGNSYIVGSSSSNRAIIAKYNSSGTIQWQKQLYYDYGGASNANFTKSMTVDSSGNIYVGVSWSLFDSQYRNIVKYNSSGTLVWQKQLSTTSGNPVYHGNMTTDSSGNLYATFGESSDMPFFIKFDSSGNIIFMRKVSFDNGSNGGGGSIFISNAGDIYFAVNSSIYGVNQGRVELLKVPGDGSKTGSWTIDGRSYTYSAKTGVSFSNSSLTNSASTIYTDNSSSLSTSTPTLTESSTSLTTGFSLL
jgi:hypothetical protein